MATLCNSMDSYMPRVPYPSLSPRVCSDSCPLSLWYYLTISSTASLFSFCLQSFPASGSFPMSPLFHIRWPEYWSFSISPSNKYSGFIAFRTAWFDLLAVEGTLNSLLQHPSWKESVLRCSAFFMVCISHPYMTTGKTIKKHTS